MVFGVCPAKNFSVIVMVARSFFTIGYNVLQLQEVRIYLHKNVLADKLY